MTLTKREISNSTRNVFSEIAEQNGVTAQEVRNEIMRAIALAMESSSENEDSIWSTMPKKGEVPTPEELILWVAAKAQESLY